MRKYCSNTPHEKFRIRHAENRVSCGESRYGWFSLPIDASYQRTSLHKGVLVVPEYFNILVTCSHIKETCNGGKFELNRLLFL